LEALANQLVKLNAEYRPVYIRRKKTKLPFAYAENLAASLTDVNESADELMKEFKLLGSTTAALHKSRAGSAR